MNRTMDYHWLRDSVLAILHGLGRYVRYWTSHSYRIECAYQSCQNRGPIAYVKYEGERIELRVRQYNGSAYLLSDGRWYGPQHLHDIVTLRWASGDARP